MALPFLGVGMAIALGAISCWYFRSKPALDRLAAAVMGLLGMKRIVSAS